MKRFLLAPTRWHRLFVLPAVLAFWLSGCGGSAEDGPRSQSQESLGVPEDEAGDLSSGATVPVATAASRTDRKTAMGLDGDLSPSFAGGTRAHLEGAFGPLHAWPIIPIAMVLMPDGRVFAYGSDTQGKQGAKLYYTIWDPAVGTGTDAFLTLPNTTDTDIFCGGQALIPETGQALILGGDASVNGKRNYANGDVNVFDPTTSTMVRQAQSMRFKRWYATAVTLPNGEHVVLGGRIDKDFAGTRTVPATVATYASTPEVRRADGSWHILSSAASDFAYGWIAMSYFYPRAWVNPYGGLYILSHSGAMFQLDTSGTGTLLRYESKVSKSSQTLPSVMFAPGRILSVRENRIATVVDINGHGEPVTSPAGTLAKDRQYGTATVLADGKVWVNGGSSTGNDLEGMALDTELWNPDTGTWTTTASAATARLYHSASVLLPDGTVLTGGGGAPGPLTQLNGEIFYPPYLFERDGSGKLAVRPVITKAPTTTIGWDQEFTITATHNIARITLVRLGAVTHDFNNETRFFDLPVPETGTTVRVRSPGSANLAPPGFYMLFAWNRWGFPSVAKIVRVG